MAVKIERDKIIEAMYKKAIGYDIDDDSEEIVLDGENGEVKNHKKKLSKKHYAPDIIAARECLKFFSEEMLSKYDSMNETELLQEKNRLLKELEKAEDEKIDTEDENGERDDE